MKLILKAFPILSIITTLEICSAKEPAQSVEASQKEAFTPESVLPEGVDTTISTNPYTGESGPARKGTVAATLNNIALLNTLFMQEGSSKNQEKERVITQAITSLIPSLRFIGVFDLFTPDEWLASETQPGRILAVVLYLQKYPQEITPQIKERLLHIQQKTKIKALSESITTALKEAK